MGLPFQFRRKDDQPLRERRRMRKGMYVIPSLFTTFNIAAGYYALAQTLQGTMADPWHFDKAAIAIGVAIVFDGLDGRIARMTNTTSEFGRELDSLADVIAFGVAPAVLAWMWGFRMVTGLESDLRAKLIQVGAIATFLLLVAGASRLARFNIQQNPQPSNPGRPGRKYFVGMPIPAGAAVISSVVHFFEGKPLVDWWQAVIWLVLILAAGFLMVSTWRFYSAKELDMRSRRPFRLVLFISAFIAAIAFYDRYVLVALALGYMCSGVLTRLSYMFRRRTPAPAPPYSEASEL